MIPNLEIERFSPSLGKFYVSFSNEEIINIFKSMELNKYVLNLEHTNIRLDIKVVDSFLKNDINLSKIPKDFLKLPNGTWFLITEYNKLFENGIKGLSISSIYKIIDTKKGKVRFFDDYKKVSNDNEFNNFYLDMKGGGTNTGRNEHGEPHVHIYQKNHIKNLVK